MPTTTVPCIFRIIKPPPPDTRPVISETSLAEAFIEANRLTQHVEGLVAGACCFCMVDLYLRWS